MRKSHPRLLVVLAVGLGLGMGMAIAGLPPVGSLLPRGFSEPSGWRATNPGGGGWFMEAEIGPDGLLVAASDLSGAYVSRDGGQSWEALGSQRGLTVTHVASVGLHPRDPQTLLLGTEWGLFVSFDGGLSVRPAQGLEQGYITDVALSPADPAVGYAAHHPDWDEPGGRVYRSDDGGRSWRAAGALPPDVRLLDLVLHPEDPDVVYALAGSDRFASGPMGVYRSRDGGARWERLAPQVRHPISLAFWAPPRASAEPVLLLGELAEDDAEGSPGRLWRSDDGGASWHLVGERGGVIWPVPGSGALRLFDPFHQFPWDERHGIWESRDGGRSWRRISGVEEWEGGWSGAYWRFNTEPRAVAVAPDGEALIWATSQWVFMAREADDGTVRVEAPFTDELFPDRWRSRGLDNVVPWTLALSAADPETVYGGYADLGLWVSPDGGRSWRNGNDPRSTGGWEGHGGNATALLADPGRPGVVWAAQAPEWEEPGTLLRSVDAGRSWEATAGLPPALLLGLSLDPRSPREARVLFVTAGGDVYRSLDDGRTWHLALSCGGCRFTAAAPLANGGLRVYAGGEAGLWRSERGGAPGSWERVGPPEFAGPAGREPWEWGWEGVSAIAPDPRRPGSVYVAVHGEGRGLYVSPDGGRSWEKLLSDDFLWDVAVSPADSSTLLAASSSAFLAGGYDPASRGVLLSRDGGRSWVEVNEGLPWPFALRVAFHPADPRTIWVASPGRGFHVRELVE